MYLTTAPLLGLPSARQARRIRAKDKQLSASERSERDTYRGNTIENRGCLFI